MQWSKNASSQWVWLSNSPSGGPQYSFCSNPCTGQDILFPSWEKNVQSLYKEIIRKPSLKWRRKKNQGMLSLNFPLPPVLLPFCPLKGAYWAQEAIVLSIPVILLIHEINGRKCHLCCSVDQCCHSYCLSWYMSLPQLQSYLPRRKWVSADFSLC